MSSNLSIQQKPTSIIFLDIDGVLIADRSNPQFAEKIRNKVKELFKKRLNEGFTELEWRIAASHFFSETAKANLEKLIKKTSQIANVAIVISSDWREDGSVEDLREQVFSGCSFSRFIIDKTPYPSKNEKYGFNLSTRARQIDFWLRENHEKLNIKSFVILDDIDQGFSLRYPFQFVHVDNLLSEQDVGKAYDIMTQFSFSSKAFYLEPEQKKSPSINAAVIQNKAEPMQISTNQSQELCESEIFSQFPSTIKYYLKEFSYKNLDDALVIINGLAKRVSEIYASFLTSSGHQNRDTTHLHFFYFPETFPPTERVDLFKTNLSNTITRTLYKMVQDNEPAFIRLSTDLVPEKLLNKELERSEISSTCYDLYKLFPEITSTSISSDLKNRKIRISIIPTWLR
jgi:HAD domain in Swiss Army Knife RNA repair proteins